MGASSGIFNSPALPSIAMFFAECRGRCEDQEVGRVGGPPEKNADRRIHYKPVAESPGASRKDCRSSVQILTARAERKGLRSFSSSGLSVNWRLAIRVLLWRWHFGSPLSNGGEHHTGDMARLDSAREHDASFPIAPVLRRPRHEYWRSSTVSRVPMASIGQVGLEKAWLKHSIESTG